ncbi:hypothetical protein IFO70_15935 [Phormidium tenue FACHB-886]|nr:hypothetical protein [Phormidium tenue FACHB-886]
MNAKHRILVATSLVGFLTLAGCSTSQPQTSAPAADSSPAAVQQSTASLKHLGRLVNSTRRAVRAEDFATAQTEFDKFNTQWTKVQAEVQTKSPDAYSTIETQKQQLATALQSNDRVKAMTSLKTLKATVAQVAQ